MKLFVLIMLAQFQQPTSFCKGWAAGVQKGWCYGREAQCTRAVIPPCPPPKPNADKYDDGFGQGLMFMLKQRGLTF